MSGDIDHAAATELRLFIDNDGDLYRQQYQPIIKNLVTKQARGVYDKDKAIKLWLYLVESGAKKYVKECGSGEWHQMFNVPTRKEVARQLNEHFLTESALGAYASLLPKKYQPGAHKPIPRKSVGIWKPTNIGDYWYIVNMTTGKKVKIGPIGGRSEAYSRACDEADRRNGEPFAWQKPQGGKRRHSEGAARLIAAARALKQAWR